MLCSITLLSSLKNDSFNLSFISCRIEHKSRDFSFIIASEREINLATRNGKKIGVRSDEASFERFADLKGEIIAFQRNFVICVKLITVISSRVF